MGGWGYATPLSYSTRDATNFNWACSADLTSFILSIYQMLATPITFKANLQSLLCWPNFTHTQVLATPITFKANLQSMVLLEVAKNQAKNQASVLFTMWAANIHSQSSFLTLLICTFGRWLTNSSNDCRTKQKKNDWLVLPVINDPADPTWPWRCGCRTS